MANENRDFQVNKLDAIEQLRRKIEELSREKDAAVKRADYKRCAELRDEAETARRKIAEIQKSLGP